MARRTKWSDRVTNDSISSGAQSLFNLMGSLDIDERQGITTIRFIIHLFGLATVTSGAIGVQKVDFGIGLVSSDSLAASAVPDPLTNTARPVGGWLWRDTIPVLDDSTHSMPPIEIKYDIRTGRKMQGGELIMIVNNTPVSGTAFSVRLVGVIRILFLLP